MGFVRTPDMEEVYLCFVDNRLLMIGGMPVGEAFSLNVFDFDKLAWIRKRRGKSGKGSPKLSLSKLKLSLSKLKLSLSRLGVSLSKFKLPLSK